MRALDRKFHKNQGFPQDMSSNTNPQSGSIITIIFILVALLAALAFAVSQGTRSGTQNLTSQQVDLAASDLMNYMNLVKNAVRDLRIRQCTENEISFDGANISGTYNNTNSPTDNSCHVFHPSGGGRLYQSPSEQILDSSFSAGNHFGEYFFSSHTTIENVGENALDDLIMVLSWVNEDICAEINQRLFSDPTIILEPAGFSNNGNFVGTYDVAASNINLSASAAQNGAPMACFESTNHGGYHLYSVLIAR